jgi:hypothetical protein
MINKWSGGSYIDLTYAEHMLHHKNLKSIFENGLLSSNEAYRRELVSVDIADSDVKKWRNRVPVVQENWDLKWARNPVANFKHTINDLVPFYFNAKNPMMYRRKERVPELLLIQISVDVIKCKPTDTKFAIFSDGNAASQKTEFMIGEEMLDYWCRHDVNELLENGSWNDADEAVKQENVRKMCAEVLVYPSVTVSEILRIVCPNQAMYDYVIDLKQQFGQKAAHIQVVIEYNRFF